MQFAMIRRNACWCRADVEWQKRHPLLYRPLVEFMLAVPWELKCVAGEDRVLHRAAIASLVPEQVRLRRDKGQPETAILRGLKKNWRHVQPLTQGRYLADAGAVAPERFRAACERLRHGHISRGGAFSYYIAALTFERWMAAGGLRQIDHARREYRHRMESMRRRLQPNHRPARAVTAERAV